MLCCVGYSCLNNVEFLGFMVFFVRCQAICSLVDLARSLFLLFVVAFGVLTLFSSKNVVNFVLFYLFKANFKYTLHY